jgi:hypothetical protein
LQSGWAVKISQHDNFISCTPMSRFRRTERTNLTNATFLFSAEE